MNKKINKFTQKIEKGFFQNVCSSRTNLGLLQNRENQFLCNEVIE